MNEQGDWMRQMAQWQQQYWDGWRDMAGRTGGGGSQPSGAAPWPDALSAWQRGSASAAAGPFDQNEVVERMLGYGKQYLELLQGLMTGRGFAAGAGGFDPQAWLTEMRELQQRYGQGLGGALGPAANLPWVGGIDVSQIEQMVRNFTAAPMRGVQQELHGLLSMPAFGQNREQSERGQALVRAWLDYQVANQRHTELMTRSLTRTFDVLERKLAEHEEPGRRIESARALYDLWIDAAEQAYHEIAMSAEFRETYGELVNAQMRVRVGLNAEVERFFGQFGMPTRTEVDSIARQVHELKRQLRRAGAAAGTSSNAAASKPPAKSEKSETRSQRSGTPETEGATKKSTKAAKKASKRGTAKRARPATTSSASSNESARDEGRSSKRRGQKAPQLQSTARKRGTGKGG